MKILRLRLVSFFLIFCMSFSCVWPAYSVSLLPTLNRRNIFAISAAAIVTMMLIGLFWSSETVSTDLTRESSTDSSRESSRREYSWSEMRQYPSEDSLHRACENNDLDRVKELVRNGADIQQRKRCIKGSMTIPGTPFHKACEVGNIEIVKYLLRKGSNIDSFSGFDNRTEGSRSPLGIACYNGHLDIVKYLIERGANSQCVSNWNKGSLVHEAVHRRGDRRNILRYLLEERGEDPNKRDSLHNIPLGLAEFYRPKIIKILIDNGADILKDSGHMRFEQRLDRWNQYLERESREKRARSDEDMALYARFKRQIEKQKNLQTILDNIADNSRALEDEKEAIKEYIRDEETPVYAKLSAMAILVDSQISGVGIVEQEEVTELMRHIQFNYRFFHDAALQNTVSVALRARAVDHRGRTVFQAAPIYIHDDARLATILSQSGGMFYRRSMSYDEGHTAFRKSFAIFDIKKDEFEIALENAKDSRNKKLFRSLGNTAIVVEDLQKEVMVKDDRNQDKIYPAGFPAGIAVKITDFIGGDYGKSLYFTQRTQVEDKNKEKEKM